VKNYVGRIVNPSRATLVAGESVEQRKATHPAARGPQTASNRDGLPIRPAVWLVLLSMIAVCVPLSADDRLEALEERAFREAAALAAPSLVRIETVGGLDLVGSMLASSGPTSGVVVGADGWIITSSFNFANRPASILVTTADGRRHPATVIGADEARMLTLLKIDAGGLTPLTAAPQEEIEVGHWAIALGQTFDQPFPNVSVGLVSAVGRVWGRAIQTDAKVSPANYGGALVDIAGRGMGILVPLSPQETSETAGVEWYDSGIGFAIPLEDVYAVLERLKAGETLKPGLMGAGFADRSPIAGAAVVTRVRPGSPADQAGLQEDDTIIEAAGQPVARVPHLRHILGRQYAGEQLPVKVRRGDETLELTLTLAAQLSAYRRALLGVLPARPPVDAQTAGVDVRLVWPGSPAEKVGLHPRDRITAVNDTPVADLESLADIISHAAIDDVLAVTVQREGETHEHEVTLAAFDGQVPDSLPSAEIPASEAEVGVRTGRFVDQLGGAEDRSYWAYVPDNYNPAYAYGLLVWMHPPGDTQEAALLAAWRTHCQRRGLILVGPKTARPAGWDADAVGFVTDLVEEFQEIYTIDPRRIVLHAGRGGAGIAAAIAFRERDMFRGLSLVGTPLPVPPPETDPDAPLDFHFAFHPEASSAQVIEQTIQALRQLAFAVTTQETADADVSAPSAADAEGIARWVDALDRL
jgi:serine protease Do